MEQRESEERLTMLRSDSGSWQAQYHLGLVNLLATLCQGDNRFGQSACQTILHLSAVLSVTSDPHISFECKVPYIRFLLWVYINRADSIDASLDAHIWFFVETGVVPFLGRIRGLAASDPAAVRRLMSASAMHTLFACILPFIDLYFTHHFQLSTASPEVITLSRRLADGLLSHLECARLFVSDNIQSVSIVHALELISERLEDIKLGEEIRSYRRQQAEDPTLVRPEGVW